MLLHSALDETLQVLDQVIDIAPDRDTERLLLAIVAQ